MIHQNQPKPMHPADLKASLEKVGSSATKIARELGITPKAVGLVIYGKSTSRRTAELIAKKIGKDINEIWPDRYSDPSE